MDSNRNKIIAEALGIEPRLSYEAVPPEGHATAYSSRHKSNVEKWLADTKKRYPESPYASYHVEEWKHYPDFCGNDADAWQGILALQEKHKIYGEHHWTRDGKHSLWLFKESCLIYETDWHNSFHDAFAAAMLEKYWEKGCKNYGDCGYRLRPEIKAVLEGKE